MFTHSTTKLSDEHVNRIVTSILNKRQRNVIEQQQTFIRRNTDENNKRNNYLVDKFTMKKRTNSSKENEMTLTIKPMSPKKKPRRDDDDEDEDFISIKKRPKLIKLPQNDPVVIKTDPIKECLESIISQIENDDDATCPICTEILSNLTTLDQRQQHVNRCLEESQMNNMETKQQKSLLSYAKFSSSSGSIIRKPSTTTHLKCQICGTSFNVKRTYLSHLKKCSNQNSVQLKHVIHFAAKTTMAMPADELKPMAMIKKKAGPMIKNRIMKMEVPRTEDDEQQQLAIALSASMKTTAEPSNAFEILQAASKKSKTIDLFTTPLCIVPSEEKLKLSSSRLSNLCERLITITSSTDFYRFPRSLLLIQSQTEFGLVDWWNITRTDPHDDEIPMTQLARILNDEESI